MNIKYNKKVAVLILVITILAVILWGVIVRWSKVMEIVRYIFYSIVIAYILTPTSRWLENYVTRPKAVIILFIALTIVVVSLMILLIPLLIRQGLALLNKLPAFSQQVQDMLIKVQKEMERLGIPYSVQITLNQYIDDMNKRLISYIKERMDGAVDGAGKAAAIFTIPVLSFYFMKDRDYFNKIVTGLIPNKIRRPILQMASEINKILDRFIRGQMLVALIVGILATIGYLIIRLPYAAILGLFAGIFEIVPYFGPVLGAIPAVMIALLHSPSKLMATIVVVILVQQLESNIFTPKIMGDHVGLHPIYIIVSLWLAGVFFGVLGMFFAVPAVLILRVIIKNIYLAIVSEKY